jgi:hypothetical protein
MKTREYETMYGIAGELTNDDIPAVEGFLDDCRMVGAKKTAKYMADCLRAEADIDFKLVKNYFLSQDFSGC